MTFPTGFAVDYDGNGIPRKLPLIEFLARSLGTTVSRPLRDFLFLGVQHLTGSAVPLFHALADAGIPYHRMFLVGKAYSSHPKVISCLTGLGCRLSNDATMLSPSNPYEDEIESEIERQLTKVSGLLDRSADISALVFDEGGKAVRAIHQTFRGQARRFHCVEQTTRGLREFTGGSLLCPVINVARSNAKMEIEAPIIARSMVAALEEARSEWRPIYDAPLNDALVIGYGVVGRNLVKELLSRGYRVRVFEKAEYVLDSLPSGEKASRVEKLESELSEVPIVMGCTGGLCLSDAAFCTLRDGALLVNCIPPTLSSRRGGSGRSVG